MANREITPVRTGDRSAPQAGGKWMSASVPRVFSSPSRRVMRVLWVVLDGAVLFSIGRGVVGASTERRITDERERAMEAMLNSVTGLMTPEKALAALKREGFSPIVWNPHEARGYVGLQQSASGRWRVVVAQRRVEGGWLGDERWLEVTFLFTADAEEAFRGAMSRVTKVATSAAVIPSSAEEARMR